MSALGATGSFRAENLGQSYTDGVWLFRNLSFDLVRGNSYALTGPSGAGKSTLMSILAGWRSPTEGDFTPPHRDQIHWVFQNPHGVPGRTAADHLALPYLARGYSAPRADAHARRMLRQFGLENRGDTPFRYLSGGESQRLMLARGLATKPQLLLIDEPTAQLDPESTETVNRSIAQVVHEDVVVVVATHDHDTRDACGSVIELGRARSRRDRGVKR